MTLSTDGFQNAVNIYPAPAVPGDFAGANIRANVVAGGQAFVASPAGVTVGAMAWANPATGIISTYYQPSSFPCFIHRDNQGLITAFLGISTTLVPGNTEVTGMDQGDFWGLFGSGATVGQKVYANAVTGALTSGATGGSVTASNPTGTVSSNVLTLTGSTTGTIAIGQVVTGGTLPAGTYVLSGSGLVWTLANVDGTAIPNNASAAAYSFYGVTETQFYVAQGVSNAASFTATLAAPAGSAPFSVLTVSAISTGTLGQGMYISSTGSTPVPAADLCEILSQLTGTAGSTGTYLVSNPAAIVVSSGQTFAGAFGQLGKISSWTRST